MYYLASVAAWMYDLRIGCGPFESLQDAEASIALLEPKEEALRSCGSPNFEAAEEGTLFACSIDSPNSLWSYIGGPHKTIASARLDLDEEEPHGSASFVGGPEVSFVGEVAKVLTRGTDSKPLIVVIRRMAEWK